MLCLTDTSLHIYISVI